MPFFIIENAHIFYLIHQTLPCLLVMYEEGYKKQAPFSPGPAPIVLNRNYNRIPHRNLTMGIASLKPLVAKYVKENQIHYSLS